MASQEELLALSAVGSDLLNQSGWQVVSNQIVEDTHVTIIAAFQSPGFSNQQRDLEQTRIASIMEPHGFRLTIWDVTSLDQIQVTFRGAR